MAVGFVCGGVTFGILVAVVMLRYERRDSAGHGLPMAIQTKLGKHPKKYGEAQVYNEAEMTVRNSIQSTVNPLGRYTSH